MHKSEQFQSFEELRSEAARAASSFLDTLIRTFFVVR